MPVLHVNPWPLLGGLLGSNPYAPGGSGSVAWGDITGTLADQTDLQAALDAKLAGIGGSSDGEIPRFDGLGGDALQGSGVVITDAYDVTGILGIYFKDGGGLQSGAIAGNTLLIRAYDSDGAAYVTFITLTAGNTPTCDLSTAVTIGGNAILSAAAIGVSVQAYDADLTTWAGLTPSANAQSLVTAADYAAMRALLDLEAGTDFLSPAAIAAAYQPLDAQLTSVAGLSYSSNALKVVRVNAGETDFELATISSGATTALDNLASVAINTSLISDTDSTDDLGSSSVAWRKLYVDGIDLQASNGLRIFDGTHYWTISFGSNITADRTLTVFTGNADRSVTLSGNLDVAGDSIISGTALVVANNLSDVASAATAFSNIKQAASDTATGVLEIAVQSEMETATDTTRAVVPGRVQYHPGVAKGWCNLNGTGTIAIRASRNVSSITDNGTGDYTVTWDTDFSSADYAVVGMAASGCLLDVSAASSLTAGSARVRSITRNDAGGLQDVDYVGVAAFGDQ